VKKQMIEAHQAEMAQRDERFSALESENAALKAQLVEMTVGASFSGSNFLREKVLMTPAKAALSTALISKWVKTVTSLAMTPAGQKERAVLVDGEGKPVTVRIRD
jgi:hypothetical protein